MKPEIPFETYKSYVTYNWNFQDPTSNEIKSISNQIDSLLMAPIPSATTYDAYVKAKLLYDC